MLIFLITLLTVLVLVCIMLGYKLYKYSIIILEIEDAIEKSIDVLNERYESMEKILQKEVFFDSIEVRQVINDIKVSQDSVYYVSLILMGEKSIEKNIED